MRLRLSHFLCALVFVGFAVGLCPARDDNADAVKTKLFRAKSEYDAEVQKFNKAVVEALDKREDAIRKVGDKKQLDEVKAQRKAFEDAGELPPMLPAADLTQIRTAVTKFESAHTDAIKELVRLKQDELATAVEKEQQKFVFEAALQFGKRTYLVALKHYDVQVWNNAFTNNGTQGDKKSVRIKKGNQFVPHSIFLHPPEKGSSQVRYSLNGQWRAFRATVGVPTIEAERDPDSPLTFEVLGDGKSLWKSEPVTKRDTFQACDIRIEKVKVLTLQVHCPEGFGWARAVWFEPVIIE